MRFVGGPTVRLIWINLVHLFMVSSLSGCEAVNVIRETVNVCGHIIVVTLAAHFFDLYSGQDHAVIAGRPLATGFKLGAALSVSVR